MAILYYLLALPTLLHVAGAANTSKQLTSVASPSDIQAAENSV